MNNKKNIYKDGTLKTILAYGIFGKGITYTFIRSLKDVDDDLIGSRGNMGEMKIVRFPSAANLYVVYDSEYQKSEKELTSKIGEARLKVEIPELELKIYGKCFICRIIDGELLEFSEDEPNSIGKYLKA